MKRPKTSRAWWLDRHVHDPFVKLAQKEGYRSRAAYKLLGLDERDHLLKAGMTVVDLGAAPGGWCQVSAKKVGEKGRVIGIDLLPVEPVPGVLLFEADFTSDEGLALVENALDGKKVDLVLSDMAPNLSGVKDADQAKHYALAELALEFAGISIQARRGFQLEAGQFQCPHFRLADAPGFDIHQCIQHR